VYGLDVFNVSTPKQIYELFGEALAAYQSSGEVCAFSSKYDASKYGTPPRNLYTLSATEERGRQLFFGQAQCSACHSSATIPAIQAITQGKGYELLRFGGGQGWHRRVDLYLRTGDIGYRVKIQVESRPETQTDQYHGS
jgi:cytochrome c peroxidase